MSIQNNILPDNPNIEVIKANQTGLFTNYIYKAIPLAFDESMSYYETLCGLLNYLQNTIIPTVNNNADAVAELQSLYEELRTYVNDYFTNLDVQEEINNKLDALVEDGTLTTLISNYVQPLIDEQNENITNFENTVNSTINNFDRRLSSVASGSPQAVSSINEMTDTSKNYVLTSDGYWYYYNGTSWVRGGLYQSSQLANNSITYNKLDSELKEDLDAFTTLVAGTVINGHYVDKNNVIQNVNICGYIELDVKPFDEYVVNIPHNTNSFGNNEPIILYRYNDNLVSYIKGGDVEYDDNHYYKDVIEIPNNVNKMIINIDITLNINNDLSIVKINKYKPIDITKEQLDDKLQTMFTDTFETVELTLFVSNALLQPNDAAQINGYNIYSLDVQPDEIYKISGQQIYNNPFVAFGNANSTITYTLNGNEYVFNSITDKIQGASQQQFENYIFQIPKNCNKIYINLQNNQEIQISKNTGYKVNGEYFDYERINPLNNKTLLFVGDSICAATTPGVKGWPTLIHENNPTSYIYNYGQDGATIAQNGRDNNDVYTKIQTMYSEHPNADYIIIQGGVNDIWQNIPLGDFIENSNYNGETPYNTTTFSGALEWILHYALTHFEGKKIGYIVTQKVFGSGSFWNYMERARKICQKWSIPYIDLYNEGDLNFYITSQKQNYSITTRVPTGDGCHPNLAGYEIITPKIENWLKYKI